MSARAALSLALAGGLLASGHQLTQGQRSALAASDPTPKGSHGEEQWPLYPAGQVPGKKISNVPAESYARADPFNALGIMCSPFGHAPGNYYYNVAEPSLVPYLVDKSAPNRVNVAVVVAPGGGNDHLAIDVTGFDVARWLNKLGISAFVLKYRVPARAWSEGEAIAKMDGQRALSLARERSAALGLNFEKIGLFGASAGGMLATKLATASSRSYQRVDAVDDLSFGADFLLLLYPAISDEVMRGVGRVPSTFIAMGHGDPCVPVSSVVGFFQAMKREKVPPSELHVYKYGKHGYGTCNMYPKLAGQEVCQWTKEAQRFLATHLNTPSLNVTLTQLGSSNGAMWCPPADCDPKNICVGHCGPECWAQC